MPATDIKINLLGDSEMEHTSVGRIVTWAVTYGRYIMIGTEIVVLLAFISRFSLDRKLTDLKEETSQKQAIIEANVDFEKDIRGLQERLSKIKVLLAPPLHPLDILITMQSYLPTDVILESLAITNGKISIVGSAGTPGGFAVYMNNLQSSKMFTNIELGDIHRSPLKGIQFSYSAAIAGVKPK
jgi:Tfp pilus assembly protein PilN